MEIERQLPKPSNRGALPRLRPTSHPKGRLVLPAPERTITVPQLPLEILRQIITNYDRMLGSPRKRRRAMRRLGRTSKAFLHLAREALYRTVLLAPRQTYSPLTKLITFRHLAAFVRQIELLIEKPRDANDILAAFTACRQAPELKVTISGNFKILEVSVLRSVTCAATSLRKLHLSRDIDGWSNSASGDLDDAWWSLLESQPNLESLVITNFTLPSSPPPDPSPTVILNCLTLNVDSIEPSVFSHLAQTSESSLRRLVISVLSDHMKVDRIDLSPFTNLVELTLMGVPPVADTLARQIRQLSLTHLEVTIDDEEEGSDDGFSLMPTNWLDHLPDTLRITSLPLHPAPDVVAFLRSGACPHLEKLSISSRSGNYSDWSPWIEVAVATACARRGLRFVQRDPEEQFEEVDDDDAAKTNRTWDDRWESSSYGEQNDGQRTLNEMWARGR